MNLLIVWQSLWQLRILIAFSVTCEREKRVACDYITITASMILHHGLQLFFLTLAVHRGRGASCQQISSLQRVSSFARLRVHLTVLIYESLWRRISEEFMCLAVPLDRHPTNVVQRATSDVSDWPQLVPETTKLQCAQSYRQATIWQPPICAVCSRRCSTSDGKHKTVRVADTCTKLPLELEDLRLTNQYIWVEWPAPMPLTGRRTLFTTCQQWFTLAALTSPVAPLTVQATLGHMMDSCMVVWWFLRDWLHL